MVEYTLEETTRIIDGKLFASGNLSDQKIEQIITDSRTFFKSENALFFALKGPRNDGHQYIPELIERGVAFFVVSDSSVISPRANFILVRNTTVALQQMAAFHRSQFHYPVVGITGSNGKTMVKEWLHELLQDEFRIVRSPKSYNSQIGVPLSVLLMESHYNLGIFEAGISMPGEMKNLAAIIKPDVGIVTHLGDAHQENFRSLLHKTEEKLQLFVNAQKLVFCADNNEVTDLIRHFCLRNALEQISWSLKRNEAKIHFKKRTKQNNTVLYVEANGNRYRFQIPFTDASSVENACHCFAAAMVLSGSPEGVLYRFEQLFPVEMRLEIKKGINNNLLINDYYNSDLASLTIALAVLNQQSKKGQQKKRVILSDIRQTGIPAEQLYRQVNQLLEQSGIDELIGIGPEISAHSETFSMGKRFFLSTEMFEGSNLPAQFRDSTILIKGARAFTFEKISSRLQQKAHQTVLEIDLNALVHNLNVFKSLLNPSTKILVMVKAFSYGSGDVEIARLLQFQNVHYLAVAVADEGVELRQAGIRIPIIVMNPEEHSFQHMIDYRLEPNLYSPEMLESFGKTVTINALHQYPVHLKLDTGMNRLGIKTEAEVEEVLSILKKSDRLRVISLFSHLAAADDPALDEFTREQLNRFELLSSIITAKLEFPVDRHILNSAGIERFPEMQMEMVRLGIGLYGVSVTGLPLQNISRFKSTLSHVKKVSSGETVGYGRKGAVTRETEIAVAPVGYADGLDRKLGNGNGQAFVKGHRVSIIGNVCMDMVMLDVTGLNARPGNEVEFFGPHISLAEVAEKAGTIPYEILTGISQRVKRIYLHE